mgnify:CR=1 FL=1
MDSVFISHRTTDDALASYIASLLAQMGIKTYQDHLDVAAQSTADITKLIIGKIEQCSHLLALITPNTQGSWWVPFEIGVGQHAARRICTFASSGVTLPEYLNNWPVLRGNRDLQTFVTLFKSDSSRTILRESYSMTTREIEVQRQDADIFHLKLRKALMA